MDDDIRQLLQSLDSIEGNDSRPIPSAVPLVTSTCHQKKRWPVVTSVVGVLLVCCIGIGWYLASPRIAIVRRTIEAPVSEGLASTRVDRLRYMPVLCSNDLEISSQEGSKDYIATQYELSRYTNKRTKTLTEISNDIHDLLKHTISSPDLSFHEALSRLTVRFEEADLYHMNEVFPEIQQRRDPLKTPKERQAFDAALSCIGLGNVEAYQKRSDGIAVASVLIDKTISTIKSSRDVVETANIVKAATQLFNELKNDSLVCALVDPKTREREMLDTARFSVENSVRSLLESKQVRDLSRGERESIAYLYAVLPSLDSASVAALYEAPSGEAHRQACCYENNLQNPEFCNTSKARFYADSHF